MRSFLLLVWCLTASLLPAQDTLSRHKVPLLTIKLNAAQLVNPFKWAVSAGTDVRIAPRITLDGEGGAFLGSIFIGSRVGEHYRGLRLRGGLKFTTMQTGEGNASVGPLFKYHDIRHRRYATAWRHGRQYLEDLLIDREVRSFGISIRGGWQFFLDDDKRFFVEPFAGFGVLYHRVTITAPPDAILEPVGGIIALELPPGRSQRLDILLGIFVGYAIW